MNDIVTTHQLAKRYGDREVVHDLSLRVPEGVVYGFLGPNGAGKSTTMKMLLSLIRPSSGSIEILGEPMTRENRHRLLRLIGSLIESPPGYGHLTGAENMRIVQRLLDLSDDDVRDAVRTVHLQGHIDKKVRTYSLGMKQRLGIAMALVRRPRLLILDEPTNGLDPAGIEEIRGLLQRLAESGATVMVSSHLLGEIDKTASMLGVLAQGRLLFQGSRSELLNVTAPDVLIDCSDPSGAYESLASLSPVIEQGPDHALIRLRGITRETTARAISSLVGGGIDVYSAIPEEQALESVFMRMTQGGGLR